MDIRIIASAVGAGLLMTGGVAIAQPASQALIAAADATSPVATDSQANDLDRIVCKSGPPPTGTLIGTGRECHTQREWDRRMHEQQQELTRQQINRGN